MFVAALLEGGLQFAEELALLLGELDGGFHAHVAVQVALDAGVQALDAFAAQAELLAVLRAFGDGDDGLAFERGHFGWATGKGLQ